MTKIRIDDYPYCIPGRDPVVTERNLREMFAVLKNCGVEYYFGAIPYHMDESWIALADGCMGDNGHLVMHGFTHLHDVWDESTFPDLFPLGGEFAHMTKFDCLTKYDAAHATLSHSARYDRDHFIAPFNNYTQELLDCLNERGVKYLHTCDKKYYKYNYEYMIYGSVLPVIGKLNQDYNFAKRIVSWLQRGNSSEWATLHWYYEFRHFGDGWLSDLKTLIEECKKNA